MLGPDMNESSTTNLVQRIESAFSERKAPTAVTCAGHPDTDEYSDAEHFSGRRWKDLNCRELERYHAALFGFNDEAFCYFLPGVMCAVIREESPHIIMVDPMIAELDRLSQTGISDEFVIGRWIDLSIDECRATQEWILWLSEKLPSDNQDPLLRAYAGLEILIAARSLKISSPRRSGSESEEST
jgi:hypothetical protein